MQETKTQSEAAAYVRSIARRCRGPRVESVPDAVEALVLYRAASRGDAFPDIELKVMQDAPSVGVLVGALIEAGREDYAKVVDSLRESCGYDFNETILANPLDGKVRPYTCPSCKLEGMYRAPKITVTPDPEPTPDVVS